MTLSSPVDARAAQSATAIAAILNAAVKEELK